MLSYLRVVLHFIFIKMVVNLLILHIVCIKINLKLWSIDYMCLFLSTCSFSGFCKALALILWHFRVGCSQEGVFVAKTKKKETIERFSAVFRMQLYGTLVLISMFSNRKIVLNFNIQRKGFQVLCIIQSVILIKGLHFLISL